MRSVTYGQSVQRLLLLVILSAVSGWAWPTWYSSSLQNQPTGDLHPNPESLPQLHPRTPSQPHLQDETDFYDPYSDTDFSQLLDAQRSANKRSSYRSRNWPLALGRFVPRSKRPSVLGLDNMEFAVSILDRGKGETPEAPVMQTAPPLGRQRPQMSRKPPARQRPSSPLSFGRLESPGTPTRLSTGLGVPDLSRRVQEERARRLRQQKQEQEDLQKFIQEMINNGKR